MLIKDSEGKDVEVFTKAELDAKVDESTSGLKADLEKQKVELDAALNAGGSDKDENIKKMRDAIAAKDEEIKKISKDMTDLPDRIKADVLKEEKEDLIKNLAGKDDELKKKIEFYMGEFKKTPTTRAELKDLTEKAYLLATDGQKPKMGVFDNGVTNAGYSGRSGIEQNKAGDYLSNESANAKSIRNVFGISDEDAKKFGKI